MAYKIDCLDTHAMLIFDGGSVSLHLFYLARHTHDHEHAPSHKSCDFLYFAPESGNTVAYSSDGDGFFVSPEGHFVTARHVVTNDQTQSGIIRNDFNFMDLYGPPTIQPNRIIMSNVDVLGDDVNNDFVLLKIEQSQNPFRVERFSFVEITTRLLDDGEPVYAFGYPLGETHDLANWQGIKAPTGIVHGSTFRPRVTSAIVASQFDSYPPISYGHEPHRYAIDKAPNYGNSGGPILAVESGKVFAFCSQFQPLLVRQVHLLGAPIILMPSLYGIVSSLSNPAILAILQKNGIPLSND